MFQTSGEARYPSLLDRCIYVTIALQKGCHTTSKNSKKYSLLHLGGILCENLWYLLIAFPLVSKNHRPDTIPSKPAEGGQRVSWGHVSSFYITCTISHSSSGHYLCGPYGQNHELLLVLSRYHQTLPLDLGVLVNLLEEVLGVCHPQMILEFLLRYIKLATLWFREKFGFFFFAKALGFE